MGRIFISHTHSDRLIADALTALVERLFGNRIAVHYSSKKELEGGIAPGEDWFRWIVDQVRDAQVAFILLTPASVQKPWVLWEAGAVAGAAFASQAGSSRVFPIAFGLKNNEIPTPFAGLQLINGNDAADVNKLVDELFKRFGDGFSAADIKKFGAIQAEAVRSYAERIEPLLLRLPLSITEAIVQEWLGRLSDLRRQRRQSEADVMESWLDVAFGREADDRQRPFDVRIHRVLGELYAAAGKSADAARQLELARRLAPRDIFLLRLLGKAYLDQKDHGRAKEVLEEIASLDSKAFERNSENAALKARYCEDTNDLAGARDVLQIAFNKLPESYYLGDRLGQLLIRLNQLERARETYQRVERVLRELHEHNVWTHATALSAAVVLSNPAEVRHSLDRLQQLRPSRNELNSIERGLQRLTAALGLDNSTLEQLRAIEVAKG